MKCPFKKVDVAWIDAESDEAWRPVSELQEEIDKLNANPCYATGYLTAENKDWITLSVSTAYSQVEHHWSGTCNLSIPRGMILNMRVRG